MNENVCNDNRFNLIAKYKAKLIEATNIETSQDEMAVIDNILFRMWQMGWLDKLDAAYPWHRVEEELPEPNIQCLVRDDDNNCAVGYYRHDARAWDSPFFGWVERDDEYYKDGDLCRIGKVVAWMPIPEPPKEDA